MSNVNLIKLASSAVASSILASRPIRRIARVSVVTSNNNTKNARIKLDGTIVTDADGAAQRIIVDQLRRVSRDIRIVGEESKEDEHRVYEEEDRESCSHLLDRISCEIRERIDHVPEVDASRVSVFIDPLDGTKNYAAGNYDCVTTLIAIVLDNTPCFGVICKPFGHRGQPSLLDTGCFAVYGGTLLDGAFIAGGEAVPKPTATPPFQLEEHSSAKAVISKSRSGGIVRELLHALASQGLVDKDPLHISGAGEKTLRLILPTKNESLWFFPKPGTSLWDVAAADALLTVIGGKLTDKYGVRIDYSKSRLDADNKGGIIASNNVVLHEECVRLFQSGEWNHGDED